MNLWNVAKQLYYKHTSAKSAESYAECKTLVIYKDHIQSSIRALQKQNIKINNKSKYRQMLLAILKEQVNIC